MIKIESFAKQNKSNATNNSGGFVKSTTIINNNTTTQVSGELDTHTFWGQPYNGTQDVSGDLNAVEDINASGDITTTGNINGNNLVGSNVNATNINANNIDADSGTIDELSTLTLNSDNINNSGTISTDSITGNTGTFTTLVSTDGTITNLTVDNLTAKAAHFFELTIDEIKSVGGQIIVTPANATIDKVENIGNTYKCYFKATDGEKKITNQFAVNDQIVCSSFNAAEGTTYDVSNKFYWAKITEVSNAPVTIDGEDYHYFIIDWNDKDSDSNGVPEIGDKVAQLGNRTNATRQAAIIISAYQNQFLDNGVNAPSIVQYDGINDYSLSAHRYNIISKGLNQFKGSFTTTTGDDIAGLITTVSQKADGIETTVSNHTTQISTLNNNVQTNTTSISNLNQKSDSISARVSTNEDNITYNYNAIQDLTIDTEGIRTNVAKNTTDISNLYADPNLFGMGTYNGTTSANNKFFVKDGTAKTTCVYNDRYGTFVYNAYFDYLQYGNGNSGLYTPYIKGDNCYYTLAIDNINVENVSRIDFQIVTYNSEFDAKNDTNGSIGTFAWFDTSDDMYESNYIIRPWLNGWVRLKIKLTCTNVADDNEGNLYGQGIRLYKGEFTNWDDLPKTVSYIENISSTIRQTATDITTTVNRNVIESMNLLEQTNFNGLSNMNKWFKYTNLSGVIETGFNGSNAYKVNITGGNQVFLSQIIYKTDLSIAKVMSNRKYTFSCYFKDLATGGTQPSEMNNVTFCICKSSDYATSSNNIYADEFIYTNTNEDWQYFTTTFELPQMLTNTYYLVIRCANMQEASNFYICQPKLEIGDTATNYTQEVSDASSSMIQQTADKIRLQVQNCGIDITNSKISLNGNTEINGALTISDEDTGFVLQGEGGATQISPKSVGNYDDFINNSTTNISQLSNSNGVEQYVDESATYFTFTFSNAFNLGKIASGKSITITPSTQTFYKDYGSGNKIDITNKVFNKSNKIRIYENWTLQRTITSYAEFSYVAQGTGVIAVYIDTECSIPKSELDRGTGRLSADVSNTTLLNWSVPNDAYTLLGYDGLGLNFGTSANAFINKDNAIFRYGSAGLRISVNGVTKWNGSEWVNLLTPLIERYAGTSYVWGNSEIDILVTTSSNTVQVELPYNPYTGRMVYIRKNGSGNVTVTANKTMRSGYSDTVSSYQVNNAKLCSFLYDGQMWLINYAT